MSKQTSKQSVTPDLQKTNDQSPGERKKQNRPETQGDQIAINEFIFNDGSVDKFDGFVRGSYPVGVRVPPRYIWALGIFDIRGNFFKIEIDTRKKEKRSYPTFAINGLPFYHPLTAIYSYDVKINPSNGHSLPHRCPDCERFGDGKCFEDSENLYSESRN